MEWWDEEPADCSEWVYPGTCTVTPYLLNLLGHFYFLKHTEYSTSTYLLVQYDPIQFTPNTEIKGGPVQHLFIYLFIANLHLLSLTSVTWSSRKIKRYKETSKINHLSAHALKHVFTRQQGIAGIPDELKELYKTVWEISQKTILKMAADRGAYIDQSQSLNIHIAEPNYGKLTSMHFYGWKLVSQWGRADLKTLSSALIPDIFLFIVLGFFCFAGPENRHVLPADKAGR